MLRRTVFASLCDGKNRFHLTPFGRIATVEMPISMPSPILEALLILQDRDTKRLGLEAQLRAVPEEVARVQNTIASEQTAVDAARTELRELESKKKFLETEIGTIESKLAKYRTEQLSVRKNEEYQALGHEIQLMQDQVGEIEGRELEIMYGIDEAKRKATAAETHAKQNIAGHEARIRALREREANVTAELAAARQDVETARTAVSIPPLRLYDRLAVRTMPAVVPIRGGKCGGCHLKVSSDADSASRSQKANAELVTCDQCGRIIYWEN